MKESGRYIFVLKFVFSLPVFGIAASVFGTSVWMVETSAQVFETFASVFGIFAYRHRLVVVFGLKNMEDLHWLRKFFSG